MKNLRQKTQSHNGFGGPAHRLPSPEWQPERLPYNYLLCVLRVSCLIEDRFEGAAVLIYGDLDEEQFHLAKLRMAHFVNALRQPQRPASDKGERERFADRFGANAERARFRQFDWEHAVRENDFERLVETGGELSALNFIQFHDQERISHQGRKGHKRFSRQEFQNCLCDLGELRVRRQPTFCVENALDGAL